MDSVLTRSDLLLFVWSFLIGGGACVSGTGAWAIIKVLSHLYQWLAGGYDLEIGHF